ncbi:MAG: MBOAT family O-acyltransferase [Planctomycetota bacterium]
MLFNSWLFIAFFVVVYLVYLRVRHNAQNWLLLAASYYFYACWDWRFLSLILISTAVDFVCSRRIASAIERRTRRRYLVVSVITNLGLLGAFKYYDFFVGNLEVLLTALGIPCSSMTLGIIVPVGISFYTFQTMSYTIDVYRKELPACDRLRDFALYVAFFPQLVAGPIERGKRFLPQVQKQRILTTDGLRQGIWWVLLGYFMKVYVADNLSPFVDRAYTASDADGVAALLAIYGFTFQIYCDFAGYSHIARGISRLMGFQLIENFHMPYLATTPSDFWKRWHISLSSWLKDYLYIPLGGNRRGPARTYINLTLTMLLGGLWHGAQWKFVIWGGFHGLLLVVFRLFGQGRSRPAGRLAEGEHRPGGAFSHVILAAIRRIVATFAFFHVVCLGWIIFRCESLAQIWSFPYSVFTNLHLDETAIEQFGVLGLLIVPVILLDLLSEFLRDVDFITRWPWPVRHLAYVTMLVLLATLGARGQDEFIYFQF